MSYSPIHSVNIGTRTAKERQQRKGMVIEDMLDTLRRHLRWMQVSKTRRLSLDMVKKAHSQIQEVEVGIWSFGNFVSCFVPVLKKQNMIRFSFTDWLVGWWNSVSHQ